MSDTLPAKVSKTGDHLANERTFLAWIRTSISIIVFGFVVAKFAITLHEFLIVQGHVTTKQDNTSLTIGIGFMVMGILIALVSMVRYRIVMHRIDADLFKPTDAIIVLMGLFTAFFGGVLVVYLLMAAQSL